MSFFQNPFSDDFRGNWVLGDRQQSLVFSCPRNAGRGPEAVYSWATGPFNLSGNDADGNSRDTLVINLALQPFRGWSTISASVGNGASVTVDAIVATLNANTTFTGFFTASNNEGNLLITSLKPITTMRFYIVNGRAEEALQFNARAGVAELPTYFARDTMANVYNFPDGNNMLVLLDPSNSGGASAVDDDIIDNAVDRNGKSLGYDSNTVQEDWQLFKGNSGLFMFKKITLDSDRPITIIEYHAGMQVGAMARKIQYSYTGNNTQPDQITEIPYTLTGSDLVTP